MERRERPYLLKSLWLVPKYPLAITAQKKPEIIFKTIIEWDRPKRHKRKYWNILFGWVKQWAHFFEQIMSVYEIGNSVQFSSVQSFNRGQLFRTPWTATHQASLSITNSQSLLKLMSIESVMPSNHLILCHPLLLPPSIFPSIRGFSNESVSSLHQIAKVLEFQLQHQSFQWIIRTDLF